jgi:hypothetical protein
MNKIILLTILIGGCVLGDKDYPVNPPQTTALWICHEHSKCGAKVVNQDRNLCAMVSDFDSPDNGFVPGEQAEQDFTQNWLVACNAMQGNIPADASRENICDAGDWGCDIVCDFQGQECAP